VRCEARRARAGETPADARDGRSMRAFVAIDSFVGVTVNASGGNAGGGSSPGVFVVMVRRRRRRRF
jgi:hypothetical protein